MVKKEQEADSNVFAPKLKTYTKGVDMPMGTVCYDPHTGEIKEPEPIIDSKVLASKKYWMLYSEFMLVVQKHNSGLKPSANTRVFSYLLEKFNCDNNFSLCKPEKENMCKVLDIKNVTTISNIVKELQIGEDPLIIKHRRNWYQINPLYGVKGGEQKRLDALKILLQDTVSSNELPY